MKKLTIVIILVAVLAVGAWGIFRLGKANNTSGATNSAENNSPTTSSQTVAPGIVKMTNMLFTPSQISVDKGATVTWTNDDKVAHTVIADQGGGPASGKIDPGSSYSYTFNQSGSYQYHCNIHSAMHGTIVVR